MGPVGQLTTTFTGRARLFARQMGRGQNNAIAWQACQHDTRAELPTSLRLNAELQLTRNESTSDPKPNTGNNSNGAQNEDELRLYDDPNADEGRLAPARTVAGGLRQLQQQAAARFQGRPGPMSTLNAANLMRQLSPPLHSPPAGGAREPAPQAADCMTFGRAPLRNSWHPSQAPGNQQQQQQQHLWADRMEQRRYQNGQFARAEQPAGATSETNW